VHISLFGYSPDYELLTAVLGFVTAVLGFVSFSKSNRLSLLETRIEKLKEYAINHQVLDYQYIDIVLLGPRRCGKTSAAKLWTEAWSDISILKPSENWEVSEISVFELERCEFLDTLFEVNRTMRKELRLRIHDYPGEDRFRLEAIKKIPNLNKPVLLLFFEVDANNAGPISTNANNSYYSRAFMESVEKSPGLASGLAKVIIVFNKCDLITWPEKEARDELARINQDAINRIESLFSGKLETFLISAANNTHMISLLGSASSAALGKEDQKRLDREMRTVFEKRQQ